ncbi:MAG: hypothetical protein Q8O99_07060 [bacterium]|nr:hypothetical protein [bacterium]
MAKLRKIASTKKTTPKTYESKLQPKNQFSLDMSKGLYKRCAKELEARYGIILNPEQHFFIASKEIIYLTSPTFAQIQPLLHVEKAGIPIFKIDRSILRPTHFLGNILGHLATKNVITFTDELMQRYSENEMIELKELPLPSASKREAGSEVPYWIIQRRGYGMSVVKLLPDAIKNKFGK